MKRIVFALTLCCMILAGATKSLAETRWGVVAVGNYSKLNFNQDLAGWVGENRQTPLHGDNGFGGGAGLIGEIIIPGIGFSVDGSLIYSLYTTTVNFGDRAVWGNDGYGNERLSNHTLEIPLNLKFKYTNLNGIENIIARLEHIAGLMPGCAAVIIGGHASYRNRKRKLLHLSRQKLWCRSKHGMVRRNGYDKSPPERPGGKY